MWLSFFSEVLLCAICDGDDDRAVREIEAPIVKGDLIYVFNPFYFTFYLFISLIQLLYVFKFYKQSNLLH